MTGPLYVARESDKRGWYTPNYLGPIKCLDLKGKWSDLKKFERKIRRRIRSSNYPEELKDFFRRYVRALDERDHNTSFLKLWSLLELLTSTQKQPYRQTRRRAAFPWNKEELLEQTLIQLHEYRNSTVHAGFKHSEIESLLYQLKFVVERLLGFHLAYSNEYSSVGSLAEFLSLPRDPNVLKSQIEALKKALRYHKSS